MEGAELVLDIGASRELAPLRSSWGTGRVFRSGALVYKLWKTESERARAAREAEVMNVIAAAGFVGAARLLDTFVISDEVVITSYPYVEGGSLSAACPRDLAAVARLVAALHALPAPSRGAGLHRPINLDAGGPYLSSAENEMLADLWTIGLAEVAEFGLCYVHGDLNSENVMLDSRRSDAPVLIDFEFSRLDSPLWDLASFTLERDGDGAFTVMSEDETQSFLRSYSPRSYGRLLAMLPVFRVLFLHRVLADVSASPALARHAAGLIRTLLPRLSA